MRRTWLHGLLAVALLGAACTSGGGTPQGTTSQGVVEVKFWHPYSSGGEKTALEALVNEFNKTHPGIRVTPQFYGNSDYALTKVDTAIAGGSYPDIAYLYGSWAASIATSPKILTLNNYIKNDPSVHWTDFWPSERLAATVNGKIIGIPALVDNLAIVYNPRLFDQAGLPYPSPSWTWNDFRAAAKALTDASKQQFGWTLPGDGSEDTVWHYEAMLWEAGGDILTPDNTHAAFNSAAGVQALTMLQQMANVDHSIYIDNQNSGEAQRLFNSGKIGMIITGPWDLSAFRNIHYGVQIMPAFQNHNTISGPDNWVLFNNGPARSKAAFQFITWFTAPQQDMRYALASSHLPIRASETKLPEYKQFIRRFPGVSTFVDNLHNAVKARPVVTTYPKISQALGQAIMSAVLGKSSPKAALDQAAQQANAILAGQ